MDPKNMDVSSVSKVVAYFVFAGLGWMAQHSVANMADSIKEIQQSLSSLNVTMASVVTKQVDHTDILKDHEIRLRKAEQKP
jgi:hypothetical protein